MSDAIWTDLASLVSSTIIGGTVAYVAYRQWRTDKERLIHDRFDRRFVVYKATDVFIRNAFTIGLTEQDIVEFYNITKEAYFLFDDGFASYLENDILANGSKLMSLGEANAIEDQAQVLSYVRERRELTEWMRHQRIPARERFATFLRL